MSASTEATTLLYHTPVKSSASKRLLHTALFGLLSVTIVGSVYYCFINPNPNKQSIIGQFLHISDLHADPGYLEGSTTASQCHRLPSTVADYIEVSNAGINASTGRFGSPLTYCDSPIALINATSKYMQQKWWGSLDFVIWTGDSGRHDGDPEQPRTLDHIIEGNDIAVSTLTRAFPGIAIVPSIGNNDIYPHNQLAGPKHKLTRQVFAALAKSWHSLIPANQLATFHYGGYFAKDIVNYTVSHGGAKGITALSLNTLYFFQANKLVGGCKADNSPGLAQIAWIRYQLKVAAQRNRDIVILGHILPNHNHYRPSCYHAYSHTVTQAVPPPELQMSQQYVPQVHAQLFGHDNLDMWTFVGHETGQTWSEIAGRNYSADDSDQRLWWEKEVDEETGYFGQLIRNVWSVAHYDPAQLPSTIDEQTWETMEDDPPAQNLNSASQSMLPVDFIDSIFAEFKNVLAHNSPLPHLSVITMSPSIVPNYAPAFRIFKYLKSSPSATHRWWKQLPIGTLLDYEVYWANLTTLNRKINPDISRFYTLLYRCSDVYQINDLSLGSHIAWAKRLLDSEYLQKKFRSFAYIGTQ